MRESRGGGPSKPGELVSEVDLRGCLGVSLGASPTNVVNRYAEQQHRRRLRGKHKKRSPGYTRYASRQLYRDLGPVKLRKLTSAACL